MRGGSVGSRLDSGLTLSAEPIFRMMKRRMARIPITLLGVMLLLAMSGRSGPLWNYTATFERPIDG